VDTAVNHVGAAVASELSQLHPAQGISSVDADSDDIAGLDALSLEWRQSLVRDDWVAVFCGGGRSKNIQPTRGDDTDSKRGIAGVHKMNAHFMWISFWLAVPRTTKEIFGST
jgi:hypothetical protein